MDEIENFIEAIIDDVEDYRDIVEKELESYSLVKELLSDEAKEELLEEYELTEEMDYEKKIGKIWTLNIRRAHFKTIEDYNNYKYPKLVLSIIANYWNKILQKFRYEGEYSFPGDPPSQKKKLYRLIFLNSKEMVLYYSRFIEILEEDTELYFQVIRKMIVYATITFKLMRECEEIDERGFHSREHRDKCKQYVELRVKRSYLHQKLKEELIKRKAEREKIEKTAEKAINDALWAIYIQWEINIANMGFYFKIFEERIKENYKESGVRKSYQQVEHLLIFLHDMTEGIRPELDDKESMIISILIRIIKLINFLWMEFGRERITGLAFTSAYILYEKYKEQILQPIVFKKEREYVAILIEFFKAYYENNIEKIRKEIENLVEKANEEQRKIIEQAWIDNIE
jgi:hypothetical protein